MNGSYRGVREDALWKTGKRGLTPITYYPVISASIRLEKPYNGHILIDNSQRICSGKLILILNTNPSKDPQAALVSMQI